MYLNRHLIGVELKPDLVKAVQAKMHKGRAIECINVPGYGL